MYYLAMGGEEAPKARVPGQPALSAAEGASPPHLPQLSTAFAPFLHLVCGVPEA